MTVNTTPVEINYTGNASTTVFALPFAFAANAHVKVYLGGVLQGSGYSITGAGNPSGGTLTMTTAPGSGVALKARRVTPLTQDIDVVNNATVFASSLETGLDYALMRQQEEAFDRLSLDTATAAALALKVNKPTGIGFIAQDASGNSYISAGTGEYSPSADLQSIANLTTTANKMLYTTAPQTWALADLTAAGRALLDDADAAAQRTTLGLGPQRYDATSGNVFYGSLAPLLNNTPAGTKNGDINTGFGFGNMPNATSAYACSVFGFAAGNAITTGHSNTLLGYQTGLALTTGIMNTLVGVDAGFISTAMNRSVILGHHCVNTGNYAGTGLIAIGQQTARPLTEGDDHIVIGRNAQANSPATGSGQSVILGTNSALASSVVTSVVIGKDIMQSSGAGTRTVTDCYLAGYRALFGVRSSTDDCILGPYALFQADGSTVDSLGNTAFGGRAGYLTAATNCLFMGYRAAAKTVSGSLSGVVALGYRAGDSAGGGTALVNNDFVLANSEADSSRLIWGNFATGNVNIQNDLTIGGDTVKVTTARTPASATAAGTAGEICWDTSYIYVCTATNTWKRVAIATW